MAFERCLLDPQTLSDAAQRALSGAMKMMAARGLAPLPDPVDLVSVLYQLSLDADGSIREAAAGAEAGLPKAVLTTALSSTHLHPHVLDRFATTHSGDADLIQLIILNQTTADETLAELAAGCSREHADLIAQNEERLIRHPEIIGSLYNNRNARMSTVDRAVELAVRQELKVPGIPAWEELCRAVLGQKTADKPTSSESDEVFARATASLAEAEAVGESDGEEGESGETADIPISRMTVPMKIRLATLGNAFTRAVLVRDPIKLVALAAVKAPGVKDAEAAKYAGNHSLSDDVIAYICRQREWTKLYGIKRSLVQNPKTPLPAAIRFLQHLREKDLRMISRSKGVPSALTAQAKKLVLQRQRGGRKG